MALPIYGTRKVSDWENLAGTKQSGATLQYFDSDKSLGHMWQADSPTTAENVVIRIAEARHDESERRIWNAQIRDLGEDDYQLTETLMVTMEQFAGASEIGAMIPELELYAEGGSEYEALDALKTEILDYFDELNEMDDAEKGRRLRAHHRILRKLIAVVESQVQ